jgi:hypothetical protein
MIQLSPLEALADTQADACVALSITIKTSTSDRLDCLVDAVKAKNPKKNRSNIVDQLLTEALDRLNINSK